MQITLHATARIELMENKNKIREMYSQLEFETK